MHHLLQDFIICDSQEASGVLLTGAQLALVQDIPSLPFSALQLSQWYGLQGRDGICRRRVRVRVFLGSPGRGLYTWWEHSVITVYSGNLKSDVP